MSQMNPEQPSYETMQQAVEWFVLLNDQNVSEQDRSNWNTWLQDPQHAKAWQLVEKVHRRFSRAEGDIGSQSISRSLKAAQKDRISRRRLLQTGTALGVSGWLGLKYTPLVRVAQGITADYASRTGEVRPVTLEDGGKLWLNTASVVNVNYSSRQRQVELLAGEILIKTARDQHHRSFRVVTRQGVLIALGTQFTVRDHNGSTFVAVYEGAVKILTGQGRSLIVEAGQQTAFTDAVIQPLAPSDPASMLWSEGVIVADDMRLGDLVQELSRYRNGYLGVDPAVENLTIMGTFPIDRPDHVLSMLRDSLPVVIESPVPWWIRITQKK